MHLELGTEEWLQDGDVVELTITGLGTLRNTVKIEREAGDGHVLSSHGELPHKRHVQFRKKTGRFIVSR